MRRNVTIKHRIPILLLSTALCLPIFAAAQDDLISKGEAQLAAGNIPEATATLEQAVKAEPHSALALTRLGGAQLLGQNYAAGIESFKQAISLDGNNADAFVGMAVAYIHTARYPLARAALEEAKRLDPTKTSDADELLAWIDKRMAAPAH